MPLNGADIRQVQIAEAMKNFSRQWKSSKIENRPKNLADLNRGKRFEMIASLNRNHSPVNSLKKGLAVLTAGIAAFSITVAKPDYQPKDTVVASGITFQLGAKEARAEDYFDKLSSQELYDLATPVNDSNLPDTLRAINFYEKGFNVAKTIVFNSDQDSNMGVWKEKGEFRGDYFGQKYGPQLKSVLQQYGVDLQKLENLMRLIGTERQVMVFNEGKVSFADVNSRKIFIFKTQPGINKAIEKIYLSK